MLIKFLIGICTFDESDNDKSSDMIAPYRLIKYKISEIFIAVALVVFKSGVTPS